MGSFKTLQEVIILQKIQTIQYKQKHIKNWCKKTAIFKSQKGKWLKIEEANQSVTVKFNLSNVFCGLDSGCIIMEYLREHTTFSLKHHKSHA